MLTSKAQSEGVEKPLMACELSIFCQLVDSTGQLLGPVSRLRAQTSHEDLCLLYHSSTQLPVDSIGGFFINDQRIQSTIGDLVSTGLTESVINIRVEPKSDALRTSPVCRCASTLSGHSECILVARFSRDSSMLATGGGDGDVRIWDMTCDTPIKTLNGRNGGGGWVTCLAWSFDSQRIVAGCRKGLVSHWSLASGSRVKMTKHVPNWVSCVAFNPTCTEIVSGSKDTTIKVWLVNGGSNRLTLSGHQGAVSTIVWPTARWLISGSHDRTIRLWDIADRGVLIHQVSHGHWVNSLACHRGNGDGCLVASASDDFTVGLWDLSLVDPKLTKLTGHCQPVVGVAFSPDGQIIASCSFDKSVKLWSSRGKFLFTLLGHVGRVYQIAWSPDSRYLISASADSTVKLWSARTGKLRVDLPGHADEVYTLDWSQDGHTVATGGKDQNLKIWKR